ncbi:MAG: hypothetical protein QOD63_1447 [Actinomycetota bacterium]|nr:hypothetical protein [Actinomycetota bacterium]
MRKRMVKTLVAVAAAATLLLSGAQGAGARVCENCNGTPQECGGSAFWNCEGNVPGW